MKKLLLLLGLVLCLPMIVLLGSLYWWFMTDTWFFNVVINGDKAALAFIFFGLGIPIFTTASVIDIGEKK
jgi:hypothetical protein